MALQIRSRHRLPDLQKNCKGSVGTLLVVFALCIFLIAPLAIKGLSEFVDWCLYQRAGQYVDQVIMASEVFADPASLSSGQAKIKPLTAKQGLSTLFEANLPAALKGKVSLDLIEFSEWPLPYDPDHWMAERQPQSRPVIVFNVSFKRRSGDTIPLRRTVELVID